MGIDSIENFSVSTTSRGDPKGNDSEFGHSTGKINDNELGVGFREEGEC